MVIFVGLCFLLVTSIEKAQIGNSALKTFNPYEILEIHEGATEKEVKKAFRELSKIYHPDKNKGNPEAAAHFLLLVKAHDCLTVEEAKANCEKFGNPDGKSNFQVAIALPNFLLQKENKLLVLSVFFLVIVVVIPLMFYFWVNDSNKTDENGVLVDSLRNRVLLNNQNLILKNLIEFLARSAEAAPFRSAGRDQQKDLFRLEDKNFKPARADKYFKVFMKPYYLLVGYIKRDQIGPSIREDLQRLLQRMPTLLEGAVFYAHHFCIVRYSNLNLLPFEKFKSVIEYSQMFYQGITPNVSSLLQLTGVDEDLASRLAKKMKKANLGLGDLVHNEEIRKAFIALIDKETQPVIEEQLKYFPKVSMTVKPVVKLDDQNHETGLDEKAKGDQIPSFYFGDLLTFEVTVKQENLKEKETSGFVQSEVFPFRKKEQWYFIGFFPENKLIFDFKKVNTP